MSKKVEVIIGVYPNQISLDLSENSISIALQYSIDDVRNIDKKNSNYSKTITVPGTKKNNKAFGNLFDVNATFDQYNPNLKIDARIVVDSSPVLEGYLQLTKVNKLNNADLQGNQISYEVVVFDDSVDFIQTLGDKKVEDLNFSTSNHIYNKTNITNAWSAHTYDDVYQYPLLDKITKEYFTKDFKPAFYHKSLLLKIAEEAGYTLQGSFITDNDSYEKEIIMWDGDTPTITDGQAIQREYRVGATGSTSTFGNYNHTNTNLSSEGKIPSNNINYNDIVTAGFFDNTGGYSANLPGGSSLDYSQWQCTNTGKYEFGVTNNFTVTYNKLNPLDPGELYIRGRPANGDPVYPTLRCSIVDVDTGFIYAQSSRNLPRYQDLPLGVNGRVITGNVSFNLTSKTIPKDAKIKVLYTFTSSTRFGWGYRFGDDNERRRTPVNIQLDFNPTANSVWFNKTVKKENIEDGDEIEINQYLPKEIKQKDILSDIIRRYNVYVRKHPTKTKTLLLDSRDDFYDTNVSVLDWTQKKDYSSQDKIAFLSDLQNKEILFTYKEANDIAGAGGGKFNEKYNASTGDIYGQKLITFNNDFAKGVKKIESIFSTTPLVFRGDIGNNVVVPTVSTSESKRKPVLCYWGGMIDVKDENGDAEELQISWGSNSNNTVQYSTYPYAGHWDNPYDPTIDIHFGEITFEYYGKLLNGITDNNLFNKYWKNYITQISNGKLVTSKFYLRETDINFIKDNLNSRIFIKDSYYVINKIVDYKPLEDGLTSVELLRIEQGSIFSGTTTQVADIPYYVTVNSYDQYLSQQDNTRNGPYRSNISNQSASSNVMMLGNNNYVGENSTGVINGNNNTVFDDSTGVNITGNDNTVVSGVENVTIVGDGVTVTESNTSVINGTTLSDGSTLSGLWEVGGGLDSVAQISSVGANESNGRTNFVVGENNISSGIASAVVGGQLNVVDGTLSGTLGGSGNALTGDESAMIGGFNNTLTASQSAIIGGTGISATLDNVVTVPSIGFGNQDTGWVFLEIEMGDWDMLSTLSIAVSHGLSTTEYKTIRQASTEIRDDGDTVVTHNFYNGNEGQINATTSTDFNLTRTGGGIYDSALFSTTSYNRGFITFWYKPD